MVNEFREEPTFKKYDSAQANAYAASRNSYHENLFRVILDHHRSTGGSFGTLLDAGCGPGNSTRPLAKYFEKAYGIDPSLEMINTAKSTSTELKAGKTSNGNSIDFIVGRAEDIGNVQNGPEKVDLLISAMAAHWFDMPRFWKSATQVLNKGGTVALWTASSSFLHPSTPNAARIQEAMFQLSREHLAPYELPGNRLTRDGYDNLPLPWTIEPPVQGFSRAGFNRMEWDRDGHLSDPDHFFLGEMRMTVKQAQKHLGTSSSITRWREAHPGKAGTEEDVVAIFTREMKELLGAKEEVVVGRSCHLLMLKKDE